MDTAGTCLRNTQVLHLRQSTDDRRCNAQSSQDTARLGLEYWEEKTKGTQGYVDTHTALNGVNGADVSVFVKDRL